MNLLCKWFAIWCTAGTISGRASVWDGDTIYIDRQAIRLAGIDAEELDEPHGEAARQHLIQLIGSAPVTCRLDGWSYKRRVGTCGELNARMVRDGFALDCARYSQGRYRHLEPAGARARLIQKGYCQ